MSSTSATANELYGRFAAPNKLSSNLAVLLSFMHIKLGGDDVQDLLDVLLDTRFDIAAFREEIKCLRDCEVLGQGHAQVITAKYLCSQKQ